ncbi:hypothetical protein Hanom_Chr09g00761921 [Helianthus anomalus]
MKIFLNTKQNAWPVSLNAAEMGVEAPRFGQSARLGFKRDTFCNIVQNITSLQGIEQRHRTPSHHLLFGKQA